jgi:hypothetical protein
MNALIKRGVSVFLTIFSFMSCNLEVNTSDPQASSDIITSKKNGFFISEYISAPLPNNTMFHISEAWVEAVWFNKIRNGKAMKEKSNGFQLNLKLSDFSNPELAEDKYLSSWEMKDGTGNVFGTGNGVYILFLKSGEVPDTFHIAICKIKEDTSRPEIFHFAVFRKK